MQTLWKQAHPLHPAFLQISACLADDWFLLPFEIQLQQAHAQVLQAVGVLSQAEGDALRCGLEQIRENYADQPCPQTDAEDLHTWMENALTELAGDAGRKIHTARSRNDQVATLIKLYVIASGERIADYFGNLAELLCRRVEAWSELVFPLQTHGQFAAPGNVGFWALRYANSWVNLRRHLGFLCPHWRQFCPLGSGAVAGSSIPIDRQMQANLLGFEGPSLSALESTTTRDECLELLAIACQAALHLQALATDVIGFAQTPFRWVHYPPAFATGSSMMPNKANPDAMELLRGECNAILAAHTHALLLLKGLPSGYSRDLQCIKPVVRDVVERLCQACELALAFVPRLEFDSQRLQDAVAQGDIEATFAMERLVQKGVPLREAHHRTAAEVAAGKASPTAPHAPEPEQYKTTGSANPAETRRIAELLIDTLGRRNL